MRDWSLELASPEATEDLGDLLGREIAKPCVVWLCGELGAGKTCLTRGLARGLGVPPEEPVTSPSYTLMNHYHGRFELYHFDLYRLVHADDLLDLGFEEYRHGDGVTVVEWADRFPHQVEGGLRIDLAHRDASGRKARLQGLDDAAGDLLQRVQRQWLKRGKQG